MMEVDDELTVASAPPSSSSLSDAPTTSTSGPDKIDLDLSNGHAGGESPHQQEGASISVAAAFHIAQEPMAPGGALPHNWNAIMHTASQSPQSPVTPDQSLTPRQQNTNMTPKRGSKGGRPRKHPLSASGAFSREAVATTTKLEDDYTPGESVRSRGARSKGGRPRGRGGRGNGSARGGKRKHNGDDDDGASDSSEIVTPLATTTKSGRSIQKPTTFVPPPLQSPNAKRKRPYPRRNPENAVCRVCLRGTSPTGNMIVFCDGCNTPYHRYCHIPPIDQTVVDEVDKAWHCRHCEASDKAPVPEAEVASYVSVDGASVEERKRYFSSLPHGMLITLLTKATTLSPSLPLFSADFKARIAAKPNTNTMNSNSIPLTSSSSPGHQGQIPNTQPMTNAHSSSSSAVAPTQPSLEAAPAAAGTAHRGKAPLYYQDEDEEDEEDGNDSELDYEPGYPPSQHPSHYPRPGRGLMRTLPPDREDLGRLVDEDDSKTGVFTHLYQLPNDGMAVATPPVKG